jgi:hypothetical protein
LKSLDAEELVAERDALLAPAVSLDVGCAVAVAAAALEVFGARVDLAAAFRYTASSPAVSLGGLAVRATCDRPTAFPEPFPPWRPKPVALARATAADLAVAGLVAAVAVLTPATTGIPTPNATTAANAIGNDLRVTERRAERSRSTRVLPSTIPPQGRELR